MIAYFCTIYNNKCNVNLCTIPYHTEPVSPSVWGAWIEIYPPKILAYSIYSIAHNIVNSNDERKEKNNGNINKTIIYK